MPGCEELWPQTLPGFGSSQSPQPPKGPSRGNTGIKAFPWFRSIWLQCLGIAQWNANFGTKCPGWVFLKTLHMFRITFLVNGGVTKHLWYIPLSSDPPWRRLKSMAWNQKRRHPTSIIASYELENSGSRSFWNVLKAISRNGCLKFGVGSFRVVG